MSMTELLLLMKHELVLCLVLFITLIFKINDSGRDPHRWAGTMHLLLAVNFLLGFFSNTGGQLFNGMFVNDAQLVLQKNILNGGMLIISLMAHPFVRSHRHLPEFYMLMIASLMGMFFMISSGHLLLFYVGLELATIPLAALANFNLHKSNSSEAGMKMILSSAFSSALLLLGISFLYGTTGSMSFDGIRAGLVGDPLQSLAFVMVFAGFAFKLSAVPFHFWTADVYEGAPVPVAAYLSVISKAAVTFIFLTVLYGVFAPLSVLWYYMLFLLAALTIGIGNLFALRQDNIKRFLAFSSITQVGFILAAITAGTAEGETSVVYFLLIYLFSNLGAFSVVNIVSAATGREHIQDYRGLYKTNPLLTWMLTISLFSLAGVPPTAGFFGKLFLLTAGASTGNYVLAGFAAVNMVISMYYYLRVVKAMFMEETDRPMEKITTGWISGIALGACLAGMLLTGFAADFYQYIHSLSQGI